MKYKIQRDWFDHHRIIFEVDAESKEDALKIADRNSLIGEYDSEWAEAEDQPIYSQEFTTVTEVQE